MKNKILTKRLIDDTSPSTHWLKNEPLPSLLPYLDWH